MICGMCNGILFSPKEEWKCVLCKKMDRTADIVLRKQARSGKASITYSL